MGESRYVFVKGLEMPDSFEAGAIAQTLKSSLRSLNGEVANKMSVSSFALAMKASCSSAV